MNSILQLKGRFEQRSNRSRPGSPKLPKGKSVSASHLRELEKQLERILVYLSLIHIFAVLSTVRSVHQRKPQRADAGAGMPEVLRKTGVFISGASADDGEI